MTGSHTPEQTPEVSSLTVLVIDDDAFVRAMASRVFGAVGVAEVVAAGGGHEALALMGGRERPFDVIVCDLDMPEMDGVETIRHLSTSNTGAGIIISSAAAPEIVASVEELARARGLTLLGALPKPVTPAGVKPLLARLQARRPPRGGGFGRGDIDISPPRLRHALENGEMVAWYQPKVSLADGSLKGVEALVRWVHPEHGLVPPFFFVDALDEAGLSDLFTETMLRHALADTGAWTKTGLRIGVAVNVSVRALYRLDLPDVVLGLAADNALAVGQVTLEVTESGLMQDITTPFDVISRLAMKGARLSIDDFGTGYSTLQQLVRLPFKEFKVDMSFVRGAQENERVRIVLESTIEMAKRLSLSVVAEGVETRENWDMLAAMGCDLAQGWFIAKAMPPAEITTWHAGWQRRAAELRGPAHA